MKNDSHWVKKLVALILSALIIIGSIPVALAVDNSTKDEVIGADESAATQDEAELGDDTYPTITPNDESTFYEDSDGTLYLSRDNTAYLKIKMKPDEDLKDAVAQSVQNNKAGLSVMLSNDSIDKELVSACDVFFKNGILTVKVGSIIGWEPGKYTLKIKLTVDEAERELFSKDLVYVKDPPVIDNIKYDGNDELQWTSNSVELTFDVTSDILDEVTVNGEPVTGSEGSYSYTVEDAGECVIQATDKVKLSNEVTTKSILVDKNAPKYSSLAFYDENDHPVEGWTNKALKAGVTFLDGESGIDASTATVNGEAPLSTSEVEGGVTVYFNADSRKAYVVKCKDNVGNEATYTVEADAVKIDKEAPKAEDITMIFSAAEGTGDKILSFLSFGAYSNKDIKIKMDVKSDGLSDIAEDTVKLYNGETELEKDGDYFILPAPENDEESISYDLYATAGDQAGNVSDKISFNQKNIKAKLSGSDAELVMDVSEELYDVIISKVSPDLVEDFGKDGIELSFDQKHENNGITYVSGDGKVTAKIKEEITGLKSVDVYVDGVKKEATFSETDTSKKIVEQTVSVEVGDFKDGVVEHTVEFIAVANSNVQASIPVKFTSFKSAPVLDKEYGIKLDNISDGKQVWTKDNVKVSFMFAHSAVPVEEVKYYKTDDSSTETVIKPKDGLYSFDAEEYGEYTIVATDKLGNKAEFKTPVILIDKEAPQVIPETLNGFDWIAWYNAPVKVAFNVMDNPKACSGVASVTVNGNGVSVVDGKCEYTAEEYGVLSIVVTDKAGNVSEPFTTKKAVQIDKQAPVIKEVNFSAGANLKEFGAYANSNSLVMTVTAEDPEIADKIKGSGVSKKNFTVKDNSEEPVELPEPKTEINNNAIIFKYLINKQDSILDLSFNVSDLAGNSKEYWLAGENKDNKIAVTVSDSAKGYEVVNSIATPTVEIKDPKFTQGPIENEGKTYYNGEGSFDAKITDELCGIDSYETYFVKKDEVKYSGDKVVSVSGTPYETKTGISDKSKVTTVDLEIKTSEKAKLASGEHIAVVHAKNLSGNDIYSVYSVFVDNDAPKIEQYIITTSGDKNTINSNGIYSANDSANYVTVQMVYTDGDCSAGIDSTQFYNGDDKLGDGKSDSIQLTDDGQYLISGLVTDVFGQSVGNNQDIKTVPVLVNGKKLEVDKNNFEIVVNNDSNKLEIGDIDYDFDYESKDNNNIFSSKADGKGNITASVKNNLSGISSFIAKVYNENEVDQNVNVATLSESKDDYNKTVELSLTANASTLDSGKYTIVYTAVDLAGNENTKTDVFYIDKEAPEYRSMSISEVTNSDPADHVLNVLSFGLYSREDILVTVNFKDKGPSSGVSEDKVVLSVSGDKNKELPEYTNSKYSVSSDGEYGDKEYTKVFKLAKTESKERADDSFYNNLKRKLTLEITDNFDNAYGKQTPTSKVTANNNTIDLNKDFDVVATSLSPDVSPITLQGDHEFKDSRGVWYSNRPTLSFTAQDKISKIHAYKVVLNDKYDISAYAKCKYNNNEGNVFRFTTFVGEESIGEDVLVKDINVTLNTGVQGVSDYVKEGLNTIKVTVYGNNGTESSVEESFYTDFTKPVVQEFTFANNPSATPDREEENNAKANGVVNTDYGYFFANKTEVTVHVTDDIVAGAGGGSGIKQIALFTKDINASSVKTAPFIRKDANSATFLVEANFKGQLYAYAIDNVENNRAAEGFAPGVKNDNIEVYTPDSVIAETEAQHEKNSSVKITPITANVSNDHKGNKLYGDNVTLTLEAYSYYAGIKSIQYTVTSPQDQSGENRSRDITDKVDTNGNITGGWSTVSKDQNLLTGARRNIVVANNSNDIKIKLIVTDRCDYSSETDITISIDKTAPHIDVKFNPADGNKVTNGDYYKTDRTATITVYERNFNPADFKLTINNAAYSVNPGQNWNTSYSVDVSNPDNIAHVATYTFHDDNDYNMMSSFVDMAGHAADNNNKKEPEFTVDQTAPKISVTFDVNNSSTYYNVTRTATITIEEHNFYAGADYLKIVQDARGADNSTSVTPPAVSGWTTSGDTSRATITFADDGMYSFTVDFKDKALNDAVQYKENTFYIDKKIDTLEITNVEDLKAYDGEVAPVINYFDQNFAEGTYSLKKVDFGSDPETVKDIIPNESSGGGFSKIVSYSNFKKTVENDGIYMLNAHIKDKAGNEKDENKLFSVNRFGSNFMITDATTKDLVENKIYTNDAPDIQITEINVNPVTNTKIQVKRDDSNNELAKGSDFEVSQKSGNSRSWYAYDYKIFKKNFDNEGGYSLTVSSTDTFKKVISNRTAYTDKTNPELNHSKPVEFVVDKTAPIVTISGLESEYYEESSRDVTVICDDANITSDNLTVQFDNEDFKDYTISETSANIELNLKLESANGNIDREFNVVVYDKAGNRNNLEECGQVKGFRLSTSWIARVLHYNLPIVIAVGGVLVAGIALAIFLAIRKRKKNNQ